VDVLGTVMSVSQADILAQSGGTVTAVHTSIGATVPAGFIIANLDSAAASAAVLQAQGGYDAALAASKATTLQAQDTTGSFIEAQTVVRNTYQSTYTTIQGTLSSQVDQVFGNNTPVGPALVINPLTTGDTFPRQRREIMMLMSSWQATLPTVNTTDPLTLLSMEQANLSKIATFVSSLGTLAATQGSAATPAQLAALATAQTTINTLIANISNARNAYNAAQTAASVSQTQSANSTNSGVTSSQASVEIALGGLRSAQAAYERTVIRAPLAGTVNYLPIHVGDFINVNQHVATVARNNALEVVAELSQSDSNRLAVGNTVQIAGSAKGVVTTISPALNPVTKQIEVHIAVNDGATLVNGESVQVTLPTLPTDAVKLKIATSTVTTQTASSTGSIQLPLTAVKLLPTERDVFSVDTTGHIVAHPVDIGNVIGDRIEVTTPLAPDLKIITDARGLSAGDAVNIATSTSP
jgi:multidrug resistance efflux pump